MRAGRTATVGLAAALLVACTGDDAANPTETDVVEPTPTTTTMTTAESTVVADDPADVDRPVVPDAATVAERLDMLRPPFWPELQGAIESGDDWSGTVTGSLFGSADGEWHLCKSELESLPPKCGGGLLVDPPPSGRFDAEFEEYDNGLRVYGRFSVDGTFFADAVVFRERP